ncbi:peptide ABC transporter permease [Tenericutes bacterium MZ-XQ]|jgi:oligopeptide transport system permease protein|nr:peptide ABC transporter permease [Tenericutes bacterium MZ-XQ]
MHRFFIRKTLFSILTLLIVVTLVFFMLRAIPGGPFTREKPLPEATRERLEEAYGLNEPLMVQYFTYMGNLFTGDLGPSFRKPAYSVNELLATGIPQTFQIGLLAVIVIIVVGIPLGVISALKANTYIDYGVMILATVGITVPSFVIGSLFILLAQNTSWMPVGGLTQPISYLGPVVALSGYSLAFVSRLTRSSMLEVLRQDYIRTARAKGLSESKVIFKHALKNGLIPVITYIGPMIAAIMTGSFVVERIFVINGIGKYFTESIGARDYTLVIGVTLFYASFYIIMVLLVDLAYSIIDPRIRVSK